MPNISNCIMLEELYTDGNNFKYKDRLEHLETFSKFRNLKRAKNTTNFSGISYLEKDKIKHKELTRKLGTEFKRKLADESSERRRREASAAERKRAAESSEKRRRTLKMFNRGDEEVKKNNKTFRNILGF